MSMWKRHSVAIATLAATVAATPAIVQADNAAPRIVAPRIGGIAHVLKPGMLVKVADNVPGSKIIKIKDADVRVSKEQLSAYDALSPELRAKLGAPKDGSVLSANELNNLKNKEFSTVMCPW